ncbi:MAG: 3-oxoacyl-[acyl-carrier-protein] reductase [Oscillospiraceae bacterium]|jgi:3-oxoacyl-[acyl-carrier protein] reductase|nr:3-oxoacyl-[acyl-carrier-protein] reductase [Oscillospiraceae bacterium]
MELEGKIALVTGGGRGIGRELCLALARGGAAVAVNYSGSEAAALETARLIEGLGGRAITVRADVSDFAACEAMFAAVEETLGAPDILLNNAGITRDNLLLRMSPQDFSDVLGVNLTGAFHCLKLASRAMIKKRWGRIVNIASVVGLIGNAGQANYAASKAGVIALTKSAARELAGRGVTVNAIAPGFIETDMTTGLSDAVREQMLGGIPQKRLGAPSDIAAAAVFLCSGGAAYITGQVLAVDGGMTMGG